jgi:hypothetical protein
MSKINQLRKLKLKILKDIFKDINYRASQKEFTIETKFDKKRSAIQVLRRKDNTVIYRLVEEIKETDSRFIVQEIENSQIKVYEHFISYMSFYGIFTVEYSYDEEQREKLIKEKALKREEEKKNG